MSEPEWTRAQVQGVVIIFATPRDYLWWDDDVHLPYYRMKFLFATLLLSSTFGLAAQEQAATHVYSLEEVDERPLFPDTENWEEAGKEMLQFIYERVEVSQAARDARASGRALTRFTLEKDGTLSEIELIEDPGYGMGEEALYLVSLMQEEVAAWTPAKMNGKAVRVEVIVPLNFRVE